MKLPLIKSANVNQTKLITNKYKIIDENKKNKVDETSVVNNDNDNDNEGITEDRLKNDGLENEKKEKEVIREDKKKKTNKKKGVKKVKKKKTKANPPKKNKKEGIKQNNNLVVKNDEANLETNKNNQKLNKKGKTDEKNKTYRDDEELNELPYEKAIEKDKRNFCQYYIFILRAGHVVLNVFFRRDDYNLFSVKLGLLFMLFPINLTFNIFFFIFFYFIIF